MDAIGSIHLFVLSFICRHLRRLLLHREVLWHEDVVELEFVLVIL